MTQAVKDIMDILLRFHWRERVWILGACARTIGLVELLRAKRGDLN